MTKSIILFVALLTVMGCGSGGGSNSLIIDQPEVQQQPQTMPGVVVDGVTNLVWQKQDDGTKRSWNNANIYCNNLSIGGVTGWRVPSVYELITILKYSTNNPSIEVGLFPGAVPDDYWSNTYDNSYLFYPPAGDQLIWYVDFLMGYVYSADSNDENNTKYVRCVKGTGLTYSFIDNNDGTIKDNNTKLLWQKGYNQPANWYYAAGAYDSLSNNSQIDICGNLNLAGYSGWRLPTVQEIESIMGFTFGNNRYLGTPYINTSFFNVPGGDYPGGEFWTATSPYEPHAWYARFFSGGITHGLKTGMAYSRCVRTIPP